MAKEKQGDIMVTMEDFFKKAPALPENGRELLVNIAPWLSLVFGVWGILVGLVAVGFLTALSPLAAFGGAYGVASYGGGVIAAWLLLGSSVLLLASFPGLRARKMSGWNLSFWYMVVNVVGSLLGGAIFGAVVGGLIGFYLLFQVKSHYK